ncbi:hypothetical protein [Desulfovibrio psychrotolerans]|uniref:Signal peptidase I n=1 Tax=Desulfovibrio psychrotolerans TaxID=415242 RepID=A0A7J0BSM8_9BACT|nr:hypothetical protein [Desulfovibrio psychrotolerans]GFM36707.1 hypothetical protein DSM19430T_13910 [Desulfovibrio psychrotolerans]
MAKIIRFALSLLFPGVGQMLGNNWKKGILFFLPMVLVTALAGAASLHSGNDTILLLMLLLVPNIVFRIWAACDAAASSALPDTRIRPTQKVAIITCCIALSVAVNAYGDEERITSFKMAAGSEIMEPVLPAGARILASGPNHWKDDTHTGDFVIVRVRNAHSRNDNHFVLKIHGVAGEPRPLSATPGTPDTPEGPENMIPAGHYLVGATDPQRFHIIVPEEDIRAKALCVYWPPNIAEKL